MNAYETLKKHETQMQDRRRELKTEVQRLAVLKKVLQAKIASVPKAPRGFSAT